MMIALSLVQFALLVALAYHLWAMDRALKKKAEAQRRMAEAAEEFQAHLRISIQKTENAIEKLREMSEPK